MLPAMAFPTTRWSVVLGATRKGSGEDAAPPKALHELCAAYWRPLYAYLRRAGHSPQDAEDAVQGFLSSLLSGSAFAHVDRDRGRFRSYLLGAMRNFLAKQRERGEALKRGGGHTIVPLEIDTDDAERRLEPRDDRTPEAEYAHAWAMEILARTRGRLREHYEGRSQAELFATLQPFLVSNEPPTYKDVATQLGMNEAAARVAVHRLRTAFRQRLREEVADTVAEETDIDDELRAVIEAVRDHA